MINIYGAPLSQPTRAVMWVCIELGIEFMLVNVDAVKGEHLTADFLGKNPNAKFPVLETQDIVLWESHAIMKYLIRKFNSNLSPDSPEDQARVDAWLDWKHTTLRVGAAGLVRRRVMAKLMKDYSKHSMSFDIKEIPESREVRILMESLKVLESQLENGGYVAGTSTPTLADIAIVCEIEQLEMLPKSEPPPFGSNFTTNFPNIARWQRAMHEMSGYKESHKGLAMALKGIERLRKKSKL